MTMSISDAPDSTAQRISSIRVFNAYWPLGNPVATAAMGTRWSALYLFKALRASGTLKSKHFYVQGILCRKGQVTIQGILKGEVSLYRWPPVWLVWISLLTVLQIKTKIVSCHTTDSKVKSQTGGQWYNDTSPLVFPRLYDFCARYNCIKTT